VPGDTVLDVGANYGWDRDRVMREIKDQGVPCFSGACSEIYLEEAFPPKWRPAERFPVAKELGETSLVFLVGPTLKCGQIQKKWWQYVRC